MHKLRKNAKGLSDAPAPKITRSDVFPTSKEFSFKLCLSTISGSMRPKALNIAHTFLTEYLRRPDYGDLINNYTDMIGINAKELRKRLRRSILCFYFYIDSLEQAIDIPVTNMYFISQLVIFIDMKALEWQTYKKHDTITKEKVRKFTSRSVSTVLSLLKLVFNEDIYQILPIFLRCKCLTYEFKEYFDTIFRKFLERRKFKVTTQKNFICLVLIYKLWKTLFHYGSEEYTFVQTLSLNNILIHPNLMEKNNDVIVKVFKVVPNVEHKELTLFYMRHPLDLEAACLDYFKFACDDSDFDDYLQHMSGPFFPMDGATGEMNTWPDRRPKIEPGTSNEARNFWNKKNKLSNFGRDSSCEDSNTSDDVILLSDDSNEDDHIKIETCYPNYDRFNVESPFQNYPLYSEALFQNYPIEKPHQNYIDNHDYGTYCISDSDDDLTVKSDSGDENPCRSLIGFGNSLRPIPLRKLREPQEINSSPFHNLFNNPIERKKTQRRFEPLPRLPDSYLEGIAVFTGKKSAVPGPYSDDSSKIKSEMNKFKKAEPPKYPKLTCLENIDDKWTFYNSIKKLKPMEQSKLHKDNKLISVSEIRSNDFLASLSKQSNNNSFISLDTGKQDLSEISSKPIKFNDPVDLGSTNINKLHSPRLSFLENTSFAASTPMKSKDKQLENKIIDQVTFSTILKDSNDVSEIPSKTLPEMLNINCKLTESLLQTEKTTLDIRNEDKLETNNEKQENITCELVSAEHIEHTIMKTIKDNNSSTSECTKSKAVCDNIDIIKNLTTSNNKLDEFLSEEIKNTEKNSCVIGSSSLAEDCVKLTNIGSILNITSHDDKIDNKSIKSIDKINDTISNDLFQKNLEENVTPEIIGSVESKDKLTQETVLIDTSFEASDKLKSLTNKNIIAKTDDSNDEISSVKSFDYICTENISTKLDDNKKDLNNVNSEAPHQTSFDVIDNNTDSSNVSCGETTSGKSESCDAKNNVMESKRIVTENEITSNTTECVKSQNENIESSKEQKIDSGINILTGDLKSQNIEADKDCISNKINENIYEVETLQIQNLTEENSTTLQIQNLTEENSTIPGSDQKQAESSSIISQESSNKDSLIIIKGTIEEPNEICEQLKNSKIDPAKVSSESSMDCEILNAGKTLVQNENLIIDGVLKGVENNEETTKNEKELQNISKVFKTSPHDQVLEPNLTKVEATKSDESSDNSSEIMNTCGPNLVNLCEELLESKEAKIDFFSENSTETEGSDKLEKTVIDEDEILHVSEVVEITTTENTTSEIANEDLDAAFENVTYLKENDKTQNQTPVSEENVNYTFNNNSSPVSNKLETRNEESIEIFYKNSKRKQKVNKKIRDKLETVADKVSAKIETVSIDQEIPKQKYLSDIVEYPDVLEKSDTYKANIEQNSLENELEDKLDTNKSKDVFDKSENEINTAHDFSKPMVFTKEEITIDSLQDQETPLMDACDPLIEVAEEVVSLHEEIIAHELCDDKSTCTDFHIDDSKDSQNHYFETNLQEESMKSNNRCLSEIDKRLVNIQETETTLINENKNVIEQNVTLDVQEDSPEISPSCADNFHLNIVNETENCSKQTVSDTGTNVEEKSESSGDKIKTDSLQKEERCSIDSCNFVPEASCNSAEVPEQIVIVNNEKTAHVNENKKSFVDYNKMIKNMYYETIKEVEVIMSSEHKFKFKMGFEKQINKVLEDIKSNKVLNSVTSIRKQEAELDFVESVNKITAYGECNKALSIIEASRNQNKNNSKTSSGDEKKFIDKNIAQTSSSLNTDSGNALSDNQYSESQNKNDLQKDAQQVLKDIQTNEVINSVDATNSDVTDPVMRSNIDESVSEKNKSEFLKEIKCEEKVSVESKDKQNLTNKNVIDSLKLNKPIRDVQPIVPKEEKLSLVKTRSIKRIGNKIKKGFKKTFRTSHKKAVKCSKTFNGFQESVGVKEGVEYLKESLTPIDYEDARITSENVDDKKSNETSGVSGTEEIQKLNDDILVLSPIEIARKTLLEKIKNVQESCKDDNLEITKINTEKVKPKLAKKITRRNSKSDSKISSSESDLNENISVTNKRVTRNSKLKDKNKIELKKNDLIPITVSEIKKIENLESDIQKKDNDTDNNKIITPVSTRKKRRSLDDIRMNTPLSSRKNIRNRRSVDVLTKNQSLESELLINTTPNRKTNSIEQDETNITISETPKKTKRVIVRKKELNERIQKIKNSDDIDDYPLSHLKTIICKNDTSSKSFIVLDHNEKETKQSPPSLETKLELFKYVQLTPKSAEVINCDEYDPLRFFSQVASNVDECRRMLKAGNNVTKSQNESFKTIPPVKAVSELTNIMKTPSVAVKKTESSVSKTIKKNKKSTRVSTKELLAEAAELCTKIRNRKKTLDEPKIIDLDEKRNEDVKDGDVNSEPICSIKDNISDIKNDFSSTSTVEVANEKNVESVKSIVEECKKILEPQKQFILPEITKSASKKTMILRRYSSEFAKEAISTSPTIGTNKKIVNEDKQDLLGIDNVSEVKLKGILKKQSDNIEAPTKIVRKRSLVTFSWDDTFKNTNKLSEDLPKDVKDKKIIDAPVINSHYQTPNEVNINKQVNMYSATEDATKLKVYDNQKSSEIMDLSIAHSEKVSDTCNTNHVDLMTSSTVSGSGIDTPQVRKSRRKSNTIFHNKKFSECNVSPERTLRKYDSYQPIWENEFDMKYSDNKINEIPNKYDLNGIVDLTVRVNNKEDPIDYSSNSNRSFNKTEEVVVKPAENKKCFSDFSIKAITAKKEPTIQFSPLPIISNDSLEAPKSSVTKASLKSYKNETLAEGNKVLSMKVNTDFTDCSNKNDLFQPKSLSMPVTKISNAETLHNGEVIEENRIVLHTKPKLIFVDKTLNLPSSKTTAQIAAANINLSTATISCKKDLAKIIEKIPENVVGIGIKDDLNNFEIKSKQCEEINSNLMEPKHKTSKKIKPPSKQMLTNEESKKNVLINKLEVLNKNECDKQIVVPSISMQEKKSICTTDICSNIKENQQAIETDEVLQKVDKIPTVDESEVQALKIVSENYEKVKNEKPSKIITSFKGKEFDEKSNCKKIPVISNIIPHTIVDNLCEIKNFEEQNILDVKTNIASKEENTHIKLMKQVEDSKTNEEHNISEKHANKMVTKQEKKKDDLELEKKVLVLEEKNFDETENVIKISQEILHGDLKPREVIETNISELAKNEEVSVTNLFDKQDNQIVEAINNKKLKEKSIQEKSITKETAEIQDKPIKKEEITKYIEPENKSSIFDVADVINKISVEDPAEKVDSNKMIKHENIEKSYGDTTKDDIKLKKISSTKKSKSDIAITKQVTNQIAEEVNKPINKTSLSKIIKDDAKQTVEGGYNANIIQNENLNLSEQRKKTPDVICVSKTHDIKTNVAESGVTIDINKKTIKVSPKKKDIEISSEDDHKEKNTANNKSKTSVGIFIESNDKKILESSPKKTVVEVPVKDDNKESAKLNENKNIVEIKDSDEKQLTVTLKENKADPKIIQETEGKIMPEISGKQISQDKEIKVYDKVKEKKENAVKKKNLVIEEKVEVKNIAEEIKNIVVEEKKNNLLEEKTVAKKIKVDSIKNDKINEENISEIESLDKNKIEDEKVKINCDSILERGNKVMEKKIEIDRRKEFKDKERRGSTASLEKKKETKIVEKLEENYLTDNDKVGNIDAYSDKTIGMIDCKNGYMSKNEENSRKTSSAMSENKYKKSIDLLDPAKNLKNHIAAAFERIQRNDKKVVEKTKDSKEQIKSHNIEKNEIENSKKHRYNDDHHAKHHNSSLNQIKERKDSPYKVHIVRRSKSDRSARKEEKKNNEDKSAKQKDLSETKSKTDRRESLTINSQVKIHEHADINKNEVLLGKTDSGRVTNTTKSDNIINKNILHEDSIMNRIKNDGIPKENKEIEIIDLTSDEEYLDNQTIQSIKSRSKNKSIDVIYDKKERKKDEPFKSVNTDKTIITKERKNNDEIKLEKQLSNVEKSETVKNRNMQSNISTSKNCDIEKIEEKVTQTPAVEHNDDLKKSSKAYPNHGHKSVTDDKEKDSIKISEKISISSKHVNNQPRKTSQHSNSQINKGSKPTSVLQNDNKEKSSDPNKKLDSSSKNRDKPKGADTDDHKKVNKDIKKRKECDEKHYSENRRLNELSHKRNHNEELKVKKSSHISVSDNKEMVKSSKTDVNNLTKFSDKTVVNKKDSINPPTDISNSSIVKSEANHIIKRDVINLVKRKLSTENEIKVKSAEQKSKYEVDNENNKHRENKTSFDFGKCKNEDKLSRKNKDELSNSSKHMNIIETTKDNQNNKRKSDKISIENENMCKKPRIENDKHSINKNQPSKCKIKIIKGSRSHEAFINTSVSSTKDSRKSITKQINEVKNKLSNENNKLVEKITGNEKQVFINEMSTLPTVPVHKSPEYSEISQNTGIIAPEVVPILVSEITSDKKDLSKLEAVNIPVNTSQLLHKDALDEDKIIEDCLNLLSHQESAKGNTGYELEKMVCKSSNVVFIEDKDKMPLELGECTQTSDCLQNNADESIIDNETLFPKELVHEVMSALQNISNISGTDKGILEDIQNSQNITPMQITQKHKKRKSIDKEHESSNNSQIKKVKLNVTQDDKNKTFTAKIGKSGSTLKLVPLEPVPNFSSSVDSAKVPNIIYPECKEQERLDKNAEIKSHLDAVVDAIIQQSNKIPDLDCSQDNENVTKLHSEKSKKKKKRDRKGKLKMQLEDAVEDNAEHQIDKYSSKDTSVAENINNITNFKQFGLAATNSDSVEDKSSKSIDSDLNEMLPKILNDAIEDMCSNSEDFGNIDCLDDDTDRSSSPPPLQIEVSEENSTNHYDMCQGQYDNVSPTHEAFESESSDARDFDSIKNIPDNSEKSLSSDQNFNSVNTTSDLLSIPYEEILKAAEIVSSVDIDQEFRTMKTIPPLDDILNPPENLDSIPISNPVDSPTNNTVCLLGSSRETTSTNKNVMLSSNSPQIARHLDNIPYLSSFFDNQMVGNMEIVDTTLRGVPMSNILDQNYQNKYHQSECSDQITDITYGYTQFYNIRGPNSSTTVMKTVMHKTFSQNSQHHQVPHAWHSFGGQMNGQVSGQMSFNFYNKDSHPFHKVIHQEDFNDRNSCQIITDDMQRMPHIYQNQVPIQQNNTVTQTSTTVTGNTEDSLLLDELYNIVISNADSINASTDNSMRINETNQRGSAKISEVVENIPTTSATSKSESAGIVKPTNTANDKITEASKQPAITRKHDKDSKVNKILRRKSTNPITSNSKKAFVKSSGIMKEGPAWDPADAKTPEQLIQELRNQSKSASKIRSSRPQKMLTTKNMR